MPLLAGGPPPKEAPPAEGWSPKKHPDPLLVANPAQARRPSTHHI